MKAVSPYPRPGFSPRDRALGMVGAWTAFVVNEAYAITSGLGYLSVASPSDPISDPFLSVMGLLVVLMAPFLVITMVAVHAYAKPEHRSYSLAALAFMVLLAGTTSIVNYSIFTVARQASPIPSPWLISFVPSGWPPLAYALDFFAWDWYFALSMLFAAPVFSGGRLQKAIRMLMIVSAVLCLLGLLLLPVSPPYSNLIGILGWGVAGPIVFLLLANLFTRTQPEPVPSPAA